MAICKIPDCIFVTKANSSYCEMHAEIAKDIRLEEWRAKKENRPVRTKEEIIEAVTMKFLKRSAAIVEYEPFLPIPPNAVEVSTTEPILVEKPKYPPAVDRYNQPLKGEKLYKFIHKVAQKEADATAKVVVPNPMIVQQHANVLDDNSPVQQSWLVNSGVCGFGWVHFERANTGFTRWLLKQKIASKAYRWGGCDISMHPKFRDPRVQSYEIKMGMAREYANVVMHYLPNEKCRAAGRLD